MAILIGLVCVSGLVGYYAGTCSSKNEPISSKEQPQLNKISIESNLLKEIRLGLKLKPVVVINEKKHDFLQDLKDKLDERRISIKPED